MPQKTFVSVLLQFLSSLCQSKRQNHQMRSTATLSSVSIISSSTLLISLRPLSFSSLASPSTTTSSDSGSFTSDYLVQTFGFSQSQAVSVSNRFQIAKRNNTPDSVLHLLRQFGFSEAHVRDAVRNAPQILFADVDRILKPKLRFFEELGLTGPDLGLFISKNSTLLTYSLDRRLAPSVEILKRILSHDSDGQALIWVLRRCKWIISKDPKLSLLPNISFLKSCGIYGSQLSTLLKRRPILFVQKEWILKDLVRKVEEMGLFVESRMFVHGLYTLSCISPETLQKKVRLFEGFGFSREEIVVMFRRTPGLLRTSVEKLRLGIEFFVNVVGLDRSALVHKPTVLMHSMEKRVIPRYRVVEILKSKKVLKRIPSFVSVVELTEEEFLERFISRFGDCAEELLVAYKDDFSDSSEEQETNV